MKTLRDYMNLVTIAEGGVTLPNADGTTPPGAFTGDQQVALNKQVGAQQGAAAHPGNPEDWAKGINPPPTWIKDNATGKYAPPGGAAPAAPAAPAAAPAAAKPAGAPNPWEGKDPAKAAAWASMTPEDQKWLGGADPTDKFILARAPKKGAPAPAAAAPAAAADDRNEMDKASDAAAAQNAAQAATIASGQPDDATGVDAAVAAQAAAPAAPTQAAQPAAKPKVMAKPDPAVMKIQQDLIAKGAKIKADGVMGPATQAAQKQFGANQTAATAARTGVAMNSQAGAGRGTMVPPVAKEGRLARTDHAFIDELNAMRSIAGLPTKNKW